MELSKCLHSTEGNIGLTVGKKRAVQVNENVCAQSHALNTVDSIVERGVRSSGGSTIDRTGGPLAL